MTLDKLIQDKIKLAEWIVAHLVATGQHYRECHACGAVFPVGAILVHREGCLWKESAGFLAGKAEEEGV